MSEQETWRELRDRRMAEPGAAEAYEAARLAYELGRAGPPDADEPTSGRAGVSGSGTLRGR